MSDEGQIVAVRHEDWKVVYLENRGIGFGVWREPFIELRVPLLFNLRRDPFERAQHDSNSYNDWLIDRAFLMYASNSYVLKFLMTLREFPPSQKPGAFNLESVIKQLESSRGEK